MIIEPVILYVFDVIIMIIEPVILYVFDVIIMIIEPVIFSHRAIHLPWQ